MKNDYKQPYNMQIEFTEGCNRMCDFCGIHGIRNKAGDYNFMSKNLIEKISIEIGEWFDHKRIEIAMHGEPTLNPNFLEMIEIMRNNFEKMQLNLTTNCIKILEEPTLLKEIFDKGINILTCDIYADYKNKLIEYCKKYIPDIKIFDYYNNPTINIYHYNSHKIKYICIMDSIKDMNKIKRTRIILNHAGNVDFNKAKKYGVKELDYPLYKKCSRPFREMVVEWNGIIPICCLDFRREFPVSKFPETTLKEAWNSKIFNIIRYLLFNKNRTLTPCRFCDYNGGFRIGFLKQPNGIYKNIENKISQHLDKFKEYSINPRPNNFKEKLGLSKYLFK